MGKELDSVVKAIDDLFESGKADEIFKSFEEDAKSYEERIKRSQKIDEDTWKIQMDI